MGYLHIDNLYKAQEILEFKHCYALEKIHGTSTHVRWDGERVGFFSGGVKHDSFVNLFDAGSLHQQFKEKIYSPCVIYGEAYGSNCQGMSKTYGNELRFVAFDVRVDDNWLNVPAAKSFVENLSLEFVHYAFVPTEISRLDAERDAPSVQAERNGMGADKIREGVVLRPVFEAILNNRQRIIAKHKRPEFSERKTLQSIDPSKREIIENADRIAEEWVTPMRLQNVIDKLQPTGTDDIPRLITAMIEDVVREAKGEIVDSREARKSIGTRTARLYIKHLRMG